MVTVQGSLLELEADVAVRPLGGLVERTELGRGAWVDVGRGFLTGTAELFERLVGAVPWQAERRVMYDRVVDVPRLVAFYVPGEALPDPAVEAAMAALVAHYGVASGGPVATAGLCYYRDGHDSVAWHGDRIGRGAREDTLVAIVSLGATRRLLLRPEGAGGPARRYELASGDLLVMGGSCQRTFEHAVPKTARPVGGRISVQFRPVGVR